jgi:glyoxylate/hydroxypyruvate reductase
MRIYVAVKLDGRQRARLLAACSGDELFFEDQATDEHTFKSCEIAFGNPRASWINSSEQLRWIQLESVGFGEYASLEPACLQRLVGISNLEDFFSEPVAESILAGILGLCRGVAELARTQARQIWLGDEMRPSLTTLHSAAVVLFGRGNINRRVEELLLPFGCAVTRFGRDWARVDMERAIVSADIVICTVPHTPETQGLFDRALISKMKPRALFANFGRGSLVDETALSEALTCGALGGAVIDVTQQEPLPLDHPFWHCPNLLLTQHTAGGTKDETDRKIDLFLSNLARYRDGCLPRGLVNFERGY